MSDVEFSEVAASDRETIEAALGIYRTAFPDDERHPDSTIRRRVQEGFNVLHVGRLEGKVVFMAMFWPFRGSKFTLFDYMATEASHRGRGIGSEFLASILRVTRAKRCFLLFEVEDPRTGTNAVERARRIRFYRRHGIEELVGIRHRLPLGAPPPAMILMLYPPYPGGAMPAGVARMLVVRLFGELYGRTAEDALVREVLTDIEGPVPCR